ncbi:hypothetical protein ACFL2T_00625 [Elusimicrobiota bacterium]
MTITLTGWQATLIVTIIGGVILGVARLVRFVFDGILAAKDSEIAGLKEKLEVPGDLLKEVEIIRQSAKGQVQQFQDKLAETERDLAKTRKLRDDEVRRREEVVQKAVSQAGELMSKVERTRRSAKVWQEAHERAMADKLAAEKEIETLRTEAKADRKRMDDLFLWAEIAGRDLPAPD